MYHVVADAPKTRPWLQFHLSTAVVLMFVASGLLWLNMRDRGPFFHQSLTTRHGWPFDATEKIGVWSGSAILPLDPNFDPLRTQVSMMGVVADCTIALAILCLVGVLCEWLIRRQERRP
jgi:hypothetical protein